MKEQSYCALNLVGCVSRPRPIMLKFLPIMLLSSAQKKSPIMLNIMPIIMPQFNYKINIIFNEYISIHSTLYNYS